MARRAAIEKLPLPNGGEPTPAELKKYMVDLTVGYNEMAVAVNSMADDIHDIKDATGANSRSLSRYQWMAAGAAAVMTVVMGILAFLVAARDAGINLE